MIKSKESFIQSIYDNKLELSIIDLPSGTDYFTTYLENYRLMHFDLNHKWLARLALELSHATDMNIQAATLALYLEHITWWDHGFHLRYLHLMLPTVIQSKDCDLIDGTKGNDQVKPELDRLFNIIQDHPRVCKAYIQMLKMCAGYMGQAGISTGDSRSAREMKKCAKYLEAKDWSHARQQFDRLPGWWN